MKILQNFVKQIFFFFYMGTGLLDHAIVIQIATALKAEHWSRQEGGKSAL